MKRLYFWMKWELDNEFHVCGYFCVMLFCYGIVEYIYGKKELDLLVILQMFLLNYVISTIQKFVLDEEKECNLKIYKRKAVLLTIGSAIAIFLSCHGLGWFKGRSIYAEIFMYVCMISAYLFVWIIGLIAKKMDTKELNDELMKFKERNQK